MSRTFYLTWWRMKGETWDEKDSPNTFVQLRETPPKWQPERLGSGLIGLKVIAVKKVTITDTDWDE